jgi:hypothetical protein
MLLQGGLVAVCCLQELTELGHLETSVNENSSADLPQVIVSSIK